MPYRGLDHSGPACYRHSAAPASETCARCLQAICDICVGFESTQPHCPPCALQVRRRRRVGRTLTVALGFVLSAGALGAVGWLLTRAKPYDYGIRGPEIRALSERLTSEPCERPTALKLVESQLAAGDSRGVIKQTQSFFARCGDWPRLSWVTYTAHERLSEHDAAIADASRLIALSPDDKDFWWWRAIAYEEKGELDKAVADYRKSLEAAPGLTGIPFNLANVLERQGKFCQARQPILQFLEYHPDVSNRSAVDARLDRLALAGHCPDSK